MTAPDPSVWPFPDDTGLPAWDERILALVPPSVDLTQVREALRRSPTERLEQLQQLFDQAAELRRGQR